LWDLRDAAGREIGPDAPERGPWLLDAGAVGQLRPPVEVLLADGSTLAAAARLLLDLHFTPALEPAICDQADLDLPALEAGEPGPVAPAVARRPRASGFAEAVLRAYAYQCAMCGFDGKLGRNPVAIQAAHVHWHSRGGPDEVANALALCALHHVLFDLGVVGITPDRRITIARDYVATTSAGRAVDGLAGQPILAVRPGQPSVDIIYIDWHRIQVFIGPPGGVTGPASQLGPVGGEAGKPSSGAAGYWKPVDRERAGAEGVTSMAMAVGSHRPGTIFTLRALTDTGRESV
jgi:putative restriction endonuclease